MESGWSLIVQMWPLGDLGKEILAWYVELKIGSGWDMGFGSVAFVHGRQVVFVLGISSPSNRQFFPGLQGPKMSKHRKV